MIGRKISGKGCDGKYVLFTNLQQKECIQHQAMIGFHGFHLVEETGMEIEINVKNIIVHQSFNFSKDFEGTTFINGVKSKNTIL